MKTIGLAIRYIKENYVRSLLTMLAIILSTVLVCGISMFGSSLDHNVEIMEKYTSIYEDASINEQVDESFLNDYESFIEQTQKNINIGTIQLDSQHYANIYAVDQIDLTPIYIIDGEMPKNSNELLIDNEYAKKYDIQINEEIQITYGDRMLQGNIHNETAFADGETFVEGSEKTYLVTGISVHIINNFQNVRINNFYTYPDETMKDRPYTILYKFHETENSATIESICSLFNNYPGNASCNQSATLITDNSSTLADIFPIIVLLVLVNTYAILRNMFAISFQERLRYFGTLSCVGATTKQIRKNLYIEILLLSVVSVFVGFLISYFGTGLIVRIYSDLNLKTNTNAFPMSLHVSPLQIVVFLIFIFGVLICCVYGTTKPLNNYSPVQLWQGNVNLEKKRKNRKIKKLKQIKPKNLESDLGKRYRSLYKYRYRSITITCVLSIILFLTGSYVTNSLSPARMTKQQDELDIQLVDTSTKDKLNKVYIQAEDLRKEISTSSFFYSKMINFNNLTIPYDVWSNKYIDEFGTPEQNNVHLQLFGISEEIISKYVADKNTALLLDVYYGNDNTSNRLLREDALRKISITQTYEDQGVIKTDSVSFDYNSKNIEAFDELNLEPYRYGVSHRTPLYVIMPLTMYQDVISKLQNSTNYQNNFVRFYEGDFEDIAEDARVYRESHPNFILNIPLKESNVNSLGFMIQSLMSCFSIFLGVICISGLCNIIFSNIITREKEYAILESTGMTRKQLFTMILVENMSMLSAAMLIAIPISILLTYLLHVLYELTPTFQFPLKECILIIMVTIICTFSIVYSACYKIRKKSIMERVKSDNL